MRCSLYFSIFFSSILRAYELLLISFSYLVISFFSFSTAFLLSLSSSAIFLSLWHSLDSIDASWFRKSSSASSVLILRLRFRTVFSSWSWWPRPSWRISSNYVRFVLSVGYPLFYGWWCFRSENPLLFLIIELARLTKKSSCLAVLILTAVGDLIYISFIWLVSWDFLDDDR